MELPWKSLPLLFEFIGHPEDVHLYLGLDYSSPPPLLQSCLYPHGLAGVLYYPGLMDLHAYSGLCRGRISRCRSTHISRPKQADINNGQQLYNSKICNPAIRESGQSQERLKSIWSKINDQEVLTLTLQVIIT